MANNSDITAEHIANSIPLEPEWTPEYITWFRMNHSSMLDYIRTQWPSANQFTCKAAADQALDKLAVWFPSLIIDQLSLYKQSAGQEVAAHIRFNDQSGFVEYNLHVYTVRQGTRYASPLFKYWIDLLTPRIKSGPRNEIDVIFTGQQLAELQSKHCVQKPDTFYLGHMRSFAWPKK